MKKRFLTTGLLMVLLMGLCIPVARAAALQYTLDVSALDMGVGRTGVFQVTFEPDGGAYAGFDIDLRLPAGVIVDHVTHNLPTGTEAMGTSESLGITNISKSAHSNAHTGPAIFTITLGYKGKTALQSEIAISEARLLRYNAANEAVAVALSGVSSFAVTAGAASDRADLSDLTVAGYALSPAFDVNTTAYAVSVPNSVTSVLVAATPQYPSATLAGVGAAELAVGLNTIAVRVTGDDGVVVSYIIKVTRAEPAGGDGNSPSGGNTPSSTGGTGTASEQPAAPPPPPEGIPFTDVGENDWFYGDVSYVFEEGLMTGESATRFDPAAFLSRAMAATVLYRLEGTPTVSSADASFTDVAAGLWYSDAIAWAAENKIALGNGDGTYRPNDNVTREQLAAFLLRYAEYTKKTLPETRAGVAFADAHLISPYAAASVDALYKAGVINGKSSNLFDPKGSATRAEFAAMAHRFCVTIKGAQPDAQS